jgi:zinc/manganese transport system substrate-binding protein
MISKSLILYFLLFSSVYAKLNVITTTPDIAFMVNKIGGTNVKVESLLDGTEDPHYVDAMPHFIAKAANADIFCQIGMSLEAGWSPKLLTKSGNKKIQKGGKGYCELGKTVKAIDIPQGKIDRSMGDVHAEGNPHFHLAPTYFLQGANTVLDILISNDPKNAEFYLKNFSKLEKEVQQSKKYTASLFKDLKNKNFLQYHKEFSYFFKEYGLNELGALEETPGVPPSAGRLARLAVEMKGKSIKAVVATTNTPEKLLNKFKQMTNIPYIVVPLGMTTNKNDGPQSFHELQMQIAKNILKLK